MSLYGALAENVRRNERIDRGSVTFTGSTTVTVGTTGGSTTNPGQLRAITAVTCALQSSTTAPSAVVLTVGGISANAFTIYAWSAAFTASSTSTNTYNAAGAVTTASFTIGASTTGAQYTGATPALLVVNSGTVTGGSISRDGTTYYSLGEAATNFGIVVQPNDWVKLTYSGSPVSVTLPFATIATSTTTTVTDTLSADASQITVYWEAWGTLGNPGP